MMNSKQKLITGSKFNQQAELSLDLVFEILLRIPIKKVYQLSCVSTLWRSVILHRDFLRIYRSRNSYALVITVSLENNGFQQINRVYHSIIQHYDENMDDTRPLEFINSLSKMNTDTIRITQPVHGLVCVCYNDLNNHMSLSLNKVRTGEIVLTLLDPDKHRLARYFLGFEPVNGVYKLLKISKPIEYFFSKTIDSNSYDLEILTISRKINDMRWIKLPKSSAPAATMNAFGSGNCHQYLDKQSFSVNGFLFWMLDEIRPLLISFDLREYKFRSFKPPSNIHYPFKYSWLAQFRGKLALFKPEFECLPLMIYTLDNYYKEGVDTCWTSHVITFTSEIFQSVKYSCKLIPVCNLPTGEILLAHVGTDNPFTSIYSYDYRNSGSLKKFVEGEFPDWAKNFPPPHIHFDVDDGFCWI